MGRKCNTLLIGGGPSSSSESFRNTATNACPKSHHTYGGRRIGHFQLHRPQHGFLPPGHHGRFSTLASIVGDDNKSCGTIHRVMPATRTTLPISKISTKNNIITTPIYQKNGQGNGNGSGMENNNRNQNIAIATQVISPSAIGSSLAQHKRRLIKSFREENVDEDGDDIFNRRKRINWNRIGCCGVSIVVTIILFTGILLAVGYLQAEKNKISTRPSKLAQNNNETLESKSSDIEPTIVIPIISDPNYHFEDLDNHSLDYVDLKIGETENSTRTEEDIHITTTPATVNENVEVYDDNTSTVVSELDNSDGNNANYSSGKTNTINFVNNNGLEDGNENESGSVLKEIIHPKPFEIYNNNNNNTKSLLDELSSPSEVKVLPPKDFNFKGFSFQIPIYNVSNPNVIDGLTVSLSTPQKSLSPDFDLNTAYSSLAKATEKSDNSSSTYNITEEELPTVAKLQTDLFEEDMNDYPEVEQTKSTFYRQNYNYKGPPRVAEIDTGYTPRPGSKVQANESRKPHNPPENGRLKPIIKFVKLRKENLQYSQVSSPSPPENFHEYHQNLQNGNYISTPFPVIPSTTLQPDIQFSVPSESGSHSPLPSGSTSTPKPFQFDYAQFSTSDPTSNNELFQNSVNNFDLSEFGLEKGTTSTNTDSNAFTLPNFTFTHFDSSYQTSTAPSAYSNSFGNNLLGSSSITNVMGLPSTLGANLNLYNPSSNANDFDFGNNQNQGTNILPGVVPLDLASSYIPVGIPRKSNANEYDSFGSQTQNYNSGSQFNLAGTSPTPNGYNTITGGIHLLNLLSGNIPKHLISNANSENQGYDQFGSGSSSSYFSSNGLTNPTNRPFDFSSFIDTDVNPYMTAYNIPKVSSFNPFLQAQGRSSNSDIEAEGSSIFQTVREPDQMGSFSQVIISKLKDSQAQAPVASALRQEEKSSITDTSDDPVNTNQVLDILGIKDLIDQFSNQRNSRSDEGSSKHQASQKDENYIASLPSEMLDNDKSHVKKDGAPILENSTVDSEAAASELLNSELLRIDMLNNTEKVRELVKNEPNNNRKKLEIRRGLQSGFYG